MKINRETYFQIKQSLKAGQVLVAVSKLQSVEAIRELYNLGHRDFGENYVQEHTQKYEQLPKDIRWHFIGHLQSNKVKYIAPFVHLIHGVDSFSLLKEINKQAAKNNRTINCLLQIHIAKEETKFGLDSDELEAIISSGSTDLENIQICGLMGMASFSDNMDLVRSEFKYLKELFDSTAFHIPHSTFHILSMGMSGDYTIALEEGSNMLRIGSLLFGARQYNKA